MSFRDTSIVKKLVNHQQTGSFLNESDQNQNKNLMLLTTQVEKLTSALELKIEEVEQLQQQVHMQPNQQSPYDEEMEQLIQTVEEQTKIIEKLALEKKELQQVNIQLQNELDMSNKKVKHFESKCQQLENEIQLISRQSLTINNGSIPKYENEISNLQNIIASLRQELFDQQQIHKELITAEETRVKTKESQKINFLQNDMKQQLMHYKNQIAELQQKLEQQEFEKRQSYNYSYSHPDNLLQNKEKLLIDLKDQLFQAQSQISILQNEIGSIKKTMKTHNTIYNQTPYDFKEKIDRTMNQINKSLLQVDQLKQSLSSNDFKPQKQLQKYEIDKDFRDYYSNSNNFINFNNKNNNYQNHQSFSDYQYIKSPKQFQY